VGVCVCVCVCVCECGGVVCVLVLFWLILFVLFLSCFVLFVSFGRSHGAKPAAGLLDARSKGGPQGP
jgi:hypothetical protein